MVRIALGGTGGLLAIVASGCGFHATTVTNTDGSDAASDGDIDAPFVPCLDRWLAGTIHFAPPVRLDTLSIASFTDRDPYVTPDDLTIYFSTNRAGGTDDIYISTRATVADSFANPRVFADATTSYDDGKLSMTDNGLRLVVSNDSLADPDLFEATRATATGTFGSLSTTYFGGTIDNGNSQQDPWISNDGLRIYYSLNTGVQHIALTTRAATDQNFQAPTIDASLDSNTGDADPALSADERIILFSSGRILTGLGGSNMWYATRATGTGAFDTPQAIPDLNTGANDGDAVLSGDGCELYFATDKSGDYDLYVAKLM